MCEGVQGKEATQALLLGSLVVGMGIHALDAFGQPPKRLPFLHDALFVSFAFLHLAAGALYLNVRQWKRDTVYLRQKTA